MKFWRLKQKVLLVNTSWCVHTCRALGSRVYPSSVADWQNPVGEQNSYSPCHDQRLRTLNTRCKQKRQTLARCTYFSTCPHLTWDGRDTIRPKNLFWLRQEQRTSVHSNKRYPPSWGHHRHTCSFGISLICILKEPFYVHSMDDRILHIFLILRHLT